LSDEATEQEGGKAEEQKTGKHEILTNIHSQRWRFPAFLLA